jgi:hypothetical protein
MEVATLIVIIAIAIAAVLGRNFWKEAAANELSKKKAAEWVSESMRQLDIDVKRYEELKNHFFDQKGASEKMSVLREMFSLDCHSSTNYEELASFADIVMRQCAPARDDKVYAAASNVFTVCKHNAQQCRLNEQP